MAKRETLELVRAYYRITDPRVRKRVFELIRSLVKAAGTPTPIRTVARTGRE